MAGQLSEYAPRCRFVELFLNGKYHGLYVLMGKIKRDKNRVGIAILKPEDISG
ncbi:MAG: CotH kinase family protein [Prolixibacteraceae bacterium]|nr:CotH kinase family protein [Prolixibacteraceae bacterium]